MKSLIKGATMKAQTYDPSVKNFKEKQQDLTELNGDGNRERGRYGEDLKTEHNNCGTPECCGTCDTADKGDGRT
jgi:hypothetical protein